PRTRRDPREHHHGRGLGLAVGGQEDARPQLVVIADLQRVATLRGSVCGTTPRLCGRDRLIGNSGTGNRARGHAARSVPPAARGVKDREGGSTGGWGPPPSLRAATLGGTKWPVGTLLCRFDQGGRLVACRQLFVSLCRGRSRIIWPRRARQAACLIP